MTGGIEAAGELATGALMGRAVEPRAGEGHGDAGTLCLNCGTTLIGPHCHRCGQAGHVHRSIGAIWHDLLHGVLHFEGKMWATLPMLITRPGELTRRYIDGERARFVSPMAMFLFSIFTMFAVLQIMGIQVPTEVKMDPAASAEMKEELGKVRAQLSTETARLDAMPQDMPGRPAQVQKVNQLKIQADILKNMGPAFVINGDDGDSAIKTGWKRLDKGIAKARSDPGLMLYKLQANTYKFSWLLIPLSIPFVWILFAWKRGLRGYDHAIFVTYSISFMSLLFITVTIAQGLGASWALIGWVIMLAPPFHLYRQLRGAYRLSRFSALWRTAMLSVFITIILTLFLMLVIGLGLVG
ncbi:DUF3667 domain-containing protein [Sphingomonas sp. FW199]|uniref:DUF3667 domain-containing protein n=1 Tax=Sphingomonas sp. FW199 TaxID=3400217 RepID=UPI003CE77557